MAANFGTVKDAWVAINIKITQQMIGNMLGINRITVGKVLKELKEVGVIMMVNGQYWVPYSKTIQRHMASSGGDRK
jgi:CRP-like cAMP-binding protein